MKKTILRVVSYLLVAVLAAGAATVGCLIAARKDFGKLDELEKLILDRYIGDADRKEMEDAVADAMVDAIGDRWSHYMTAEEYLNYKDAMSNSYVGIGVTVQKREDGKGFDVLDVVAGGPAEEAGVQKGDRLIAVDGKSVLGTSADDVRNLIRGEEGTTVSLTVDRAGEELTLTAKRRQFQTPVATYQMLEDKIGLITIENFDDRCADETIAAIEALQKQSAESLIFDVRNNPGGYKHELVELLDYLLPEGVLFRTEDYKGNQQVDKSDKNYLDMPMAVLVNLHSYSAAEFFAAAMSEYEAAIIVGEKTFGKGYFQTTYQLSDGSAVTLSIGKYYTPKGESLAGVGLTPDVEKVVDEETANKISDGTLAPEEDPHIQAAINALKTGN